MNGQKTIKKAVTVQGRGLFSGEPCRLQFLPTSPNAGIVFARNDLAATARIKADIGSVAKRHRRTSLVNGSMAVETVEHVLSAVWGMGIDNILIELNADETPSTDGSPMPFVEALQKADIQEQDADQKVFVIDEPVTASAGDAMLAALPGSAEHLDILYDLDYGPGAMPGRQVFAFRLGKDDFLSQLAPARTFVLEAEARDMQARGLGRHLTPRDILVLGKDGPIDNAFRFENEQARHKVCDLIGDLALLGWHLRGRIVGYKSGHELNLALVRKLDEAISAKHRARVLAGEPMMDIRSIMRLLPHRYPFLMVDRIIEIDGDRRVVGIKNVSINEPYFQGHYPGQPLMPGVMILEAMAQVSGILLSRRLEHTGKVAVLLTMDKVKMRRPVQPGDQLILEAEKMHVRTRTGHCRCRALLGQEVAAEADIKFMLVDAEPV